jgi:hypothetical protein
MMKTTYDMVTINRWLPFSLFHSVFGHHERFVELIYILKNNNFLLFFKVKLRILQDNRFQNEKS